MNLLSKNLFSYFTGFQEPIGKGINRTLMEYVNYFRASLYGLLNPNNFYAQIVLTVFTILLCFLVVSKFFGRFSVFGKPHHKLIKKCNVKFSDIQGCDEIKGHLEKIVMFLKDPTDFQRFGAKIPRGYLLAGPPGVGKTMLAKAVAGESGVPFLTASGTEFDEVFVGVGAKRIRALFNDARKLGKAVIFIDEIDAVAGKRSEMTSGFEKRQTVNQLLVEMDGFESKEGIVVLVATNTPESLDPAILRPGRIDKTFHLSAPNITGREKILKELFKSILESKREEGDLRNLELTWLAKLTVGYTGADLANLLNHAKMIASMDKASEVISKKHVIEAKDFIDMDPETNFEMSEEDYERTAYHEAGHAIMSLIHEGAYSVQYATIVSRGKALGLVMNIPEKDLYSMSMKMLKDRLDVFMGGFMGEKVHFDNNILNVSTGPSSDFQKANQLANQIVRSGFGERTKLLISDTNNFVSETAKLNFEEDVKDLLDESAERVEKFLKGDGKNGWIRAAWIELAQALLAKKSLKRDEIVEIYCKHKQV